TAYNQFAGLINHYANRDVEPKNFAFSMALQADGKVIVGGGFTQVGGGGARDSYTQRGNICRLIGGSTAGPGNIGFTTDTYNADENGGNRFITLTRQNGFLAPASVTFNPVANGAGPGAAVVGTDYDFTAGASGHPLWGTAGWIKDNWMLSDAVSGPNTGN